MRLALPATITNFPLGATLAAALVALCVPLGAQAQSRVERLQRQLQQQDAPAPPPAATPEQKEELVSSAVELFTFGCLEAMGQRAKTEAYAAELGARARPIPENDVRALQNGRSGGRAWWVTVPPGTAPVLLELTASNACSVRVSDVDGERVHKHMRNLLDSFVSCCRTPVETIDDRRINASGTQVHQIQYRVRLAPDGVMRIAVSSAPGLNLGVMTATAQP
ncbi:MAG TPA: hypothetical protein VEY95_18020 [Azospirillaceae bacterium]|nr:hypothetical protein [Azospirillaceae bacterium]